MLLKQNKRAITEHTVLAFMGLKRSFDYKMVLQFKKLIQKYIQQSFLSGGWIGMRFIRACLLYSVNQIYFNADPKSIHHLIKSLHYLPSSLSKLREMFIIVLANHLYNKHITYLK